MTDREKLTLTFRLFGVDVVEKDLSLIACRRRFRFTPEGEIESIVDYQDRTTSTEERCKPMGPQRLAQIQGTERRLMFFENEQVISARPR